MTNLVDYKTKKKNQVIVQELEEIMKAFLTCKKLLENYGKYVPVKDVYVNIMNNETLINIHLKKYKKLLENET